MARAIINAIFASSIMLLAPTASMAQSSFGNLLESGESSFQDFVRDNQKWLEQERKDEQDLLASGFVAPWDRDPESVRFLQKPASFDETTLPTSLREVERVK